MTHIPQRLREIAQSVDDMTYRGPEALASSLRAIAAEIEAPAADAVPVVAEVVEHDYGTVCIRNYGYGPLELGDKFVNQRDHLATVAALQARISSLEADLEHSHQMRLHESADAGREAGERAAAEGGLRVARLRIAALERNQLPAGSLPITEEKLAELIKEWFMAGTKVGAQALATELLKSGDLKPTAELFKRVM